MIVTEDGLALLTEIGVMLDAEESVGLNVTKLEGAGVDASQSSYVTSSQTFLGGRLYVISVHYRGGSVPSLSLSGATFQNIASANQTNGSVSIYRCVPGADVTGQITISFSSAPNRCAWHVVEITGTIASPSDNGASAVVQSGTATSDGTVTFTVALPSPLATNSNLCIAACTHGNNDTSDPETGWTQFTPLTTGTSWDRINSTFVHKTDSSDNSYSEFWGFNSGSGVIVEISTN